MSDQTSRTHADMPAPPNWKEVLEFIQEQSAKERALFDTWLKRAAYVLTVVTAVVAAALTLAGVNTIEGVRKEARASTKQAIEDASKQVRERVDSEFRTETIRSTIRSVAAERTHDEFRMVIGNEVANQLKNPQFAAALRKEVQRQSQVLVQAETARQLAKVTAPRKLSEIQRSELKRVLERYKGKQVTISSLIGHPETTAYAKEIAEVFRAAGWRVNHIANVAWDTGFRGVAVVYPKGEPIPELSNIVAKSLTELGINTHMIDVPIVEIDSSGVNMWISEKELE